MKDESPPGQGASAQALPLDQPLPSALVNTTDTLPAQNEDHISDQDVFTSNQRQNSPAKPNVGNTGSIIPTTPQHFTRINSPESDKDNEVATHQSFNLLIQKMEAVVGQLADWATEGEKGRKALETKIELEQLNGTAQAVKESLILNTELVNTLKRMVASFNIIATEISGAVGDMTNVVRCTMGTVDNIAKSVTSKDRIENKCDEIAYRFLDRLLLHGSALCEAALNHPAPLPSSPGEEEASKRVYDTFWIGMTALQRLRGIASPAPPIKPQDLLRESNLNDSDVPAVAPVSNEEDCTAETKKRKLDSIAENEELPNEKTEEADLPKPEPKRTRAYSKPRSSRAT